MTVSERVELIKFDEPKYLEDGRAVVGQRKEAEDLAKVIHDQGYSNIFLLGIGGTEFEFGHYEYLISRMSDVDIYSVNAADVNTVRPKKLNKDSLVITASSSGDTVEIVQAAKWMKEEGIRCSVDRRSEKMGYKIREARLERVPYMLVVGAKEEEEGKVSVRSRYLGDEGMKDLGDFMSAIKEEIKNKTIRKIEVQEENK